MILKEKNNLQLHRIFIDNLNDVDYVHSYQLEI